MVYLGILTIENFHMGCPILSFRVVIAG
jgi:hypothetical protein